MRMDNMNATEDDTNSSSSSPSPNPQLLEQLIALGFERETALLAIRVDHVTGGVSDAEGAVNWILENPELIEEAKMGASSSKAIPRNLNLFSRSQPHKMVFVVNTSLKMGAGKMAAQVAHASVALYKLCQSSQEGQRALGQWSENGEMKVVLKGENIDQLEELYRQAKEAPVFAYFVADAGHTQIPAGSRTVLGIFGTHEEVDKITGGLKLY